MVEQLNELNNRLKSIEELLFMQKEIFTFEEFCNYAGISKSQGYKLTSGKKISHYVPNGKMCYFKKSDVIEWLLQNHVKTDEQLSQEAATYVTLNKCKKGFN